MGTTAQKLQAIQNSKAAIKSAIEAKGVSDVGDVLADYATKIGEISGGGSSGDPRYEVSQQGALTKKSFALNYFNDLTRIPNNGLEYAYYKSNVTSVSFPNLTSVGNSGLNYAFYQCTSLTSVDLSRLTSVVSYGMSNAFNGCTSLTSVDLSSLTTFSNYGGSCRDVLNSAFRNCTSLTSIDLSGLVNLSPMIYGFSNTFMGCTSLRTVKLNKLSYSNSYNMANMFNGCTSLELVDFSEATAVPALSYVNTFNNTNNTFKIVVPDALYSTWTTASNWSNYASHIVKVSDYTPAS